MNRAAGFNGHPNTFSSGNIRRVSIFTMILGLVMIILCMLRATGSI